MFELGNELPTVIFIIRHPTFIDHLSKVNIFNRLWSKNVDFRFIIIGNPYDFEVASEKINEIYSSYYKLKHRNIQSNKKTSLNPTPTSTSSKQIKTTFIANSNTEFAIILKVMLALNDIEYKDNTYIGVESFDNIGPDDTMPTCASQSMNTSLFIKLCAQLCQSQYNMFLISDCSHSSNIEKVYDTFKAQFSGRAKPVELALQQSSCQLRPAQNLLHIINVI